MKTTKLDKKRATEVMLRPKSANGFGKDAWFYINNGSIDVFCDPPEPGGTPHIRLTRLQLEFALSVMKARAA